MRRQAGFSYFTVLFVVAVMGAGLALTGQVWQTAAMRDKEAELLYVGNQYRKAIERYYLSGPRQYPRTLDDLIKDPRQPSTQRYLRKLYPDPITGKSSWGTVKAPDGGVMGVYSLSEMTPIKTDNFRLRDAAFASAGRYADWQFAYSPPASFASALPSTNAVSPARPPQK